MSGTHLEASMLEAPALTRRPRAHHGIVSLVLLLLPCWVTAVLLLFEATSARAAQIQVLSYAASIIGLGTLVLLRRDYARDLGWAFLIGAHAVWFALPALYQVLVPGLWFGDWIDMEVPHNALVRAGSLISVFLLANGVGYLALRSRDRHDQAAFPEGLRARVSDRVKLVLGTFAAGIVPYLVFGGGLSQIVIGIASGRGEKAWAQASIAPYSASGMMTVFWLSRAALVCSAALAGCYLVADRQRATRRRIGYAVVVALTGLILYFDQGTRSYMAMAAVPPLAVFLLHRSRQGHTFRASRLMLIGVAAVLALLMLTQFQWMYRLERTRSDIKETSLLEVVAPRQHLDFYTETAIAVVARDTILERPLRESALFLFVVNPIPRVLWPGKPVPRTQWEYTLYRWGVDIYDQGGNAMPSIVGQYYLNWGVGGVAFIGLLLGALVRWIERRLTSGRICYEHLLLAASALTFVFLSFRFLAPGFHYSTLLLALLLFGLKLFRR